MKSCAVIFDVDGVLLDSLKPHLQICADKNIEYGLGLTIPSPAAFTNMVRSGVKISPMKFFFQAVGFPPHYADRATAQYNEVFMRNYAPKQFPGVADMLSTLASAGLHLGIATSNVRSNVDSALGSSMRFFDPECIFTKDDPVGSSKTTALRTAATRLSIPTRQMVFVGDQPADWEAAREAGVDFLGVTYGWGISEESKDFPLAPSVPAIADHVMKVCAAKGSST
jgi:phosphoglycolate phosphatase-like HAD superfamily hydrolase